jgi:hypothetical protein
MINDGRRTRFFEQHFYPFFYEKTGFSIENLYEVWIDSVKAASSRFLPQTQTPITVLWNRGFSNSMPKLSRDHLRIGWLTNDRDDFSRTDLVVMPYESSGKCFRIPWAKQSWDFSPDGGKVYYIKSRTPNEVGSLINDIFVRNLGNNRETRLIKNARAYDIAVAPDNSCLACIRYKDGAFSIVKYGIDGRDMVTIIEGKVGEPFWRLSFDPETGGRLATTRVVDGKARLCIIDIEKKTVTQISNADAQEETPFWAKNGRIYFSSDYDGISNIFSVASNGSDCLRHTSVSGGLFSPFVVDDSTFIGTDYRNRGFRIVRGALMQDISFTPTDTSLLSYKPLPKPKGRISIRSGSYEPRFLRRIWELQTSIGVNDPYGKMGDIGTAGLTSRLTDTLSFSIAAGLLGSRSDALKKRTEWVGMQVALQRRGKERDTKVNSAVTMAEAHIPIYSRFNSHSSFSSEIIEKYPRRSGEIANKELGGPLFQDNRQNLALAAREAATDTLKNQKVVPVIIPGMGLQSKDHTLSLEAKVQCYLFNVVVPGIANASCQVEWHIFRDVFADFSPQIQLYPTYLLSGQFFGSAAFPVSLLWMSSNYLNTDIAYNSRGQSYLKGTISPSYFPIGRTIAAGDGRDSTVFHAGSSTAARIQFGRGFPVMRYSSLVVGFSGSETWYSEPVADPTDSLKGASAIYTSLGLSAEYIFPIARQVNQGKIYADAFYGAFVYHTNFYTNSSSISLRSLGNAMAYRFYDSRHFFVEHCIGARLKLGVTKSFAFSQTNSFTLMWSIWAKRINVNFSAGL